MIVTISVRSAGDFVDFVFSSSHPIAGSLVGFLFTGAMAAIYGVSALGKEESPTDLTMLKCFGWSLAAFVCLVMLMWNLMSQVM